MDAFDRLSAAGSAVIAAVMLLFFLVGLAIIPFGPPEGLVPGFRGVRVLTDPLDSSEDDSVNEQVPTEAPAVAAVTATPSPGERTNPSPTPIPSVRTSVALPVAEVGVSPDNEGQQSLSLAQPQTTTPITPGIASPEVITPPAEVDQPTSPSAPTAAPTSGDPPCAQPESGISINHHRVVIERGSVRENSVGGLALSTADGPVSLVMTIDTQIIGDLAIATQVRVEAHQTGNGKIIARVVEVLCPY